MLMNAHQVAAQLYTVRDLCRTPSDVGKTLASIRSIGYAAVEVAGICPIEAAELQRMVVEEGLAVCAVHDDPNVVLDEPLRVADRAAALSCDLAVYSYPSGFDVGNEDDLRRLVGKLARAEAVLRAEGMTLCYHHHSLEFARWESCTVLDHILREVPFLNVELDTFWIQHGGGNPVKWCQRMSGRLPILHLKDYGCKGGEPLMAEIGNGNLDWPEILAAASGSGCRWFAVEQDTCPGDPLESLRISYEYLRRVAMF